MADDRRGQPGGRRSSGSQWFTGVSIALVVLICITVFAVAFVRIDPYLSDFVSDNTSPTAPPEVLPTVPRELDPEAVGTPSG